MAGVQIVVPMSGFGERFRRAGYRLPKPLIEIEGKPIVAHVIDMFPGETDFLFICNSDHLAEPSYRMEGIIKRYCPTGVIVAIPPHKLGPVHAVTQVDHLIDPERPVVVNYCDFTCYWDWDNFKDFVRATRCDGAVPAYRGFHPHTLGSTNYAYMREKDGWLLDIQEKQPYTNNRMEEYASSGTYYFASGRLMREAFRRTVEEGLQVGGEFYVSLTYKPLLADGRAIAVYPLQHFMQWGTPEDVAEYQGWSAAFRDLLQPRQRVPPAGTMVVPMAGLGQRFAAEGYSVTKPLIEVSGRPMVLQAAHDLPPAKRHAFVLRADMPGHDAIAETLAATFPAAQVTTIPGVTEGQACTALIGLEALGDQAEGPITFGACDNGALYDQQAFRALAAEPDTDIIVWGARGHANAARKPQMFGWIDAGADGVIRRISVKVPLEAPDSDPIVIGTFTFRRAMDFRRSLDRLMARDGRVNGEFYIDALINDAIDMGLTCTLFDVSSYLSWGTPNDLRTFEYWQSCFHKWSGHPYRLERDGRVPARAVADLEARYRKLVPTVPGPRP